MSNYPRLSQRRGTYYIRAAVPSDIKSTYPKTEETYSLRTKDFETAIIRLRQESAAVDRRFQEHRNQFGLDALTRVDNLSDKQINILEECYYCEQLKNDDYVRSTGFS